MYIIEVIPLTILPANVPQFLTYFFDRKLEKGSVVEVSVGSRKLNGVVLSAIPLEQQKIILKNYDFQLKKINKVVEERALVSEVEFKIAGWISQNYYAPLGYSLKTVLPAFFLKNEYSPVWEVDDLTKEFSGKKSRPLLLLTRAKDVLNNAAPFIKETLKNKMQVLVLVPEISASTYFYEELAMKYETVVINSQIDSKKLLKNWQDVSSGVTQVIIGTRQALFMPFSRLGLIVVDDPASESYKSDMTPKYNASDLALKVASIYGAKIIYTASAPSVKNYWDIKNGNCETLDKLIQPHSEIKVVDMVKEIKTGNFSMFSRDLQAGINLAIENNKKILIFSPRKGYSGVLVCENCGFSAKCPDCSIPMRIHKIPESMLVCHRCYRTDKIPPYCPNCNSSNLRPHGTAGSQKIMEHLQKYLLAKNYSVPIEIYDADIIDDSKKEKDAVEEMNKLGARIVVATQKIFSQRHTQKFDLIGVLNADALVSIPDFRTDERLLYQIHKLLDFNPDAFVVQSYNSENPAMEGIMSGNYKDTFDKELMAREMFYYPPFSRIAKLTFKNKDRDKASYAARLLSEKMKMWIVQNRVGDTIKVIGPSPAFVEREAGFYFYNLIVKIPLQMKPEELLKYVPPYWSVDLDPRSVV